MTPFFSIIIPTYNRARFLKNTIQSVLAQTCEDWELVIVDDGSVDDTRQVVASFHDSRIRYVYQENAERSAARNNGIRHATGEWICFLDSDDYFLPHHLSSFHEFIINHQPTHSFLVSGCLKEEGGKLFKNPVYDKNAGIHPARFILESTSITPISVCIHRDCLKINQFPEINKISYWEDTHLWIRLALQYPFYQLPEFTVVLAEHAGRSVHSKLNWQRIQDHILMINDLFSSHQPLISKEFTDTDKVNYIDRIYRMFLYQARKNKLASLAFRIWQYAIKNRPSLYLWAELMKIPLG